MMDSTHYPLLSKIESPADLRKLAASELPAVARELRRFLRSEDRRGGKVSTPR